MNDKLLALRVFVRVAHMGSFSAAGLELNLSQPSVPRIIAALESDVGEAPVIRTTRAVTRTEVGNDYLARIEPILAALPKATFDGEAFRGTRQSLDPLASPYSGGRWMRRDGAGVLYTSQAREGALAEISFHRGLLNPRPTKPVMLHTLRVVAHRPATTRWSSTMPTTRPGPRPAPPSTPPKKFTPQVAQG